jgi:hypothetical protein
MSGVLCVTKVNGHKSLDCSGRGTEGRSARWTQFYSPLSQKRVLLTAITKNGSMVLPESGSLGMSAVVPYPAL